MTEDIGCAEFARLIGATYPEVSRAASVGLLKVIGKRLRGQQSESNVLNREQALKIAAAVRCGIPWRVAASLSDRIQVIRAGGIRIKPDVGAKQEAARRIFHRPHR